MAESWEQEISDLLQQAQNIAVRYDIDQELTETQKTTAKGNIAIGSTATNVSGDDYKITINY